MAAIRLVSIAAAVGIVVLVSLIVFSSLEMSLLSGLRASVDTRWGITTMFDLYFGLFAVAGWIAHRERSLARTAVWLLGLCLLGNLVTLVYLLLASLSANSVSELFQPRRG